MRIPEFYDSGSGIPKKQKIMFLYGMLTHAILLLISFDLYFQNLIWASRYDSLIVATCHSEMINLDGSLMIFLGHNDKSSHAWFWQHVFWGMDSEWATLIYSKMFQEWFKIQISIHWWALGNSVNPFTLHGWSVGPDRCTSYIRFYLRLGRSFSFRNLLMCVLLMI